MSAKESTINVQASLEQEASDAVANEIAIIKKQWEDILQTLPSDVQEIVNKGLVSTYELFNLLEKKISMLDSLNNYDTLTGVFKRDYCNNILATLKPSPEHPVTIVAGDVNNLKLTNDVFGHNAGDYLLTSIADIMKKCSKPNYIIGRFGGDEFYVIMPNTSLEEGKLYCERVKQSCKDFDGVYLPPSISLGIASCSEPEHDLLLTLADAEQLMYHDKTVFKSKQNIFTDIIQHLYDKDYLNPKTTEHEIMFINEFGRYLKLPEQTLSNLRLAARIHDIGFIAIPDELIKKNHRTPDELALMTKHCETGYRLAKLYDESFPVANIILQHHESYDGTGYPHNLKGDEILYSAQILSLISTFASWCAPRPLGSGLTRQAAYERIDQRVGTQFDPRLLKQFKKYLESTMENNNP